MLLLSILVLLLIWGIIGTIVVISIKHIMGKGYKVKKHKKVNKAKSELDYFEEKIGNPLRIIQ